MAPRASAATGKPDAPRAPGRPRRADVEDLVLDATLALLAEQGIEGTTTSAVIKRSGVARATVYLRWPTHEALITDAIRRAMGRPVIQPSGDVEADLRRGAEQAKAVFESPTFQRAFPTIVAALTGQASSQLSFDVLAPGRPNLAGEYDALAASQGLRTDVAPDLVIDTIVGGFIGRYLATGAPPSDADRAQILEIVFDGLRAPSARQG